MMLATLIISCLSLMILLVFMLTAARLIGKVKEGLNKALMMQQLRQQQMNGQVNAPNQPPIPTP